MMVLTRQLRATAAVVVATTLTTALPAHSSDSAQKCEVAKLKEAGKYGACRLKAMGRSVATGKDPSFDRCQARFSTRWGRVEANGAGACPTNADESGIDARVTTHVDTIAFLLSGVTTTTTSTTVPTTSTSTTSTTLRFEDTELGTVIDHQTGLEWEKKTAGNVDDRLSWQESFAFVHGSSDSAEAPSAGGVQGLGEHTDWRLPSHTELQSILASVPFCMNPCIDPVFGPTASGFYWSATTETGSEKAFRLGFSNGGFSADLKGNPNHVRAVRGP